MKKPILFALLFFLAAPVAYAYDFGTSGIVGGLATAGALLALGFGAPAALGTIAIGALISGITFPVDHASTETPDVVVQLSPGAQLPTPTGWDAPASGQVEPSPPSSIAAVSGSYTVDGVSSSTLGVACQNAATAQGLEYVMFNAGLDSCYMRPTGTTTWILHSATYEAPCPGGYSQNGGACNLTDASQVQKPSDGACTIKRTGNSFAVDPRDPDCSSGKVPATTAISPNVITSTKADGSTKSVTINADGSSTITESRPNNSANTTETNTTTLSAPDASGAVKVTGQGSGVAPGTGTQAGSSSPAVNVNFDKSGLATEGTLGGIKSSVDAIKDGLDPGSTDSSLSAQKSAFDTAVDGLIGMFASEQTRPSTGLSDDFSISGYLPAQCGCTPLTISFHGHSASYDWCSPMDYFKDVMSWVFGILTAFYVLSLFRVGGSK